MNLDKKNILMINVDQWPGAFLGAAGNSLVMTPAIDQLARDGIRFANAYSTCPVCIPARRSLMTGTFPKTHGDRVYNPRLEMPEVPTLASVLGSAGYQTYAVGKLHVYPQRDRIGFDDVILSEEGRYEYGVTDDYQIWLGDKGYVGQEHLHGLANNSYRTRPWHLPEETHPTVWATREMCRMIKRRDPKRPGFFYLSYMAPHPPLVPLQSYLDMYADAECAPDAGNEDWMNGSTVIRNLTAEGETYSEKEKVRAIRAFAAQCTLIDSQIRIVIGTLRECGILRDTLIVFVADHGEMLFDHNMVGKRVFYDRSARIPMIFSGVPVAERRGEVNENIVCLEDLMPTLLSFCNVPVPSSVEGKDILSQEIPRKMLYCECGEGNSASRMVTDGRFKLIYYPMGNIFQLFDLENDIRELHNLYGREGYEKITDKLTSFLTDNLYGPDRNWIRDGKPEGLPEQPYERKPNYGFSNQRGYHWPAPEAYGEKGFIFGPFPKPVSGKQ